MKQDPTHFMGFEELCPVSHIIQFRILCTEFVSAIRIQQYGQCMQTFFPMVGEHIYRNTTAITSH